MKMKKWYVAPLFSTCIFYSAQEPIVPKEIRIRVETTNPSIFDFTLKVPAAERLAVASERLATAAENSSRAIASIPDALTKTALIAIGGIGTVISVYQGIKRLDKDKKDWLGFGFIGTGIAFFIALYWAANKNFTSPV